MSRIAYIGLTDRKWRDSRQTAVGCRGYNTSEREFFLSLRSVPAGAVDSDLDQSAYNTHLLRHLAGKSWAQYISMGGRLQIREWKTDEWK